jgi:hypothetical protein
MKKQRPRVRAKTDRPFGINPVRLAAAGAIDPCIRAPRSRRSRRGMPRWACRAPEPAQPPYRARPRGAARRGGRNPSAVFTCAPRRSQAKTWMPIQSRSASWWRERTCIAEAQRVESLGFDFVDRARRRRPAATAATYLRDPRERSPARLR